MNFYKLSFAPSVFLILMVGSALAETIKVSIPDMECKDCSKAVEDRLKQEKDITKVTIDLKAKVATVYTADTAKLSDDQIRALVKDSGFEAKTIERLN